MTAEETLGILITLETAYPNFYKGGMAEEQKVNAMILWAKMFTEDSAQLVAMAVEALLTTNKWPPSISEVKEKILMLTRPPDMTELEAWGKVYKAIGSANYYAQENFDNLPPILQRLVGSPNQLREWAQMDTEDLQSVVSSNFHRSYTARVKQEKEYQVLPSSSKQIVGELIKGKFNMPELAEGEGLK